MFAELLGFGDYYFELGVQILEACWASRPLNGGLMELGALRCARILLLLLVVSRQLPRHQ